MTAAPSPDLSRLDAHDDLGVFPAPGVAPTTDNPVSLSIVRAIIQPSDLDRNGRVDRSDAAAWFDCLAGLYSGLLLGVCTSGDVNRDDRVDLRDAAALTVAFGG